MSAGVVARPAAAGRSRSAHRWAIGICAACALALAGAVLVRGYGYYASARPLRATSPLHPALKPGGSVGHPLGILGGSLFLMVYLYPLRKRWKWLGRRGKTKNWLDYHILMGLTAPLFITLHSSFKLAGIAGLAYWIMLAVVASGIVGRYLYGRIPRKLDQAEMSLEELEGARRELALQIQSQRALAAGELEPLLALPPFEQVQRMPLPRALALLVRLDARRWLLLRRMARIHASHPEVKRALGLVRRQTALARDILFLSKMQKLFRLWHVVHRPFSYSFALLAALHVLVVMLLGFY